MLFIVLMFVMFYFMSFSVYRAFFLSLVLLSFVKHVLSIVVARLLLRLTSICMFFSQAFFLHHFNNYFYSFIVFFFSHLLVDPRQVLLNSYRRLSGIICEHLFLIFVLLLLLLLLLLSLLLLLLLS